MAMSSMFFYAKKLNSLPDGNIPHCRSFPNVGFSTLVAETASRAPEPNVPRYPAPGQQ